MTRVNENRLSDLESEKSTPKSPRKSILQEDVNLYSENFCDAGQTRKENNNKIPFNEIMEKATQLNLLPSTKHRKCNIHKRADRYGIFCATCRKDQYLFFLELQSKETKDGRESRKYEEEPSDWL